MIDVDAPPVEVWCALVDVARWPKRIAAAALDGPLAPGPTIGWPIGAARVRSVLIVVEVGGAPSWSSSDGDARTRHGWRLTATGADTRLTSARSVSGGLAAQDPSMVEKVLIELLNAWTRHLKAEAKGGKEG